MEHLAKIIPKLVSFLLSILDAGNLRHQLYEIKEKLEIATVALDDINRINDVKLIKDIAKRTLDKL